MRWAILMLCFGLVTRSFAIEIGENICLFCDSRSKDIFPNLIEIYHELINVDKQKYWVQDKVDWFWVIE